MKSTAIPPWSHAEVLSVGTRKVKAVLAYPLTFIALVCVFLWLAFYVASQFI